MDDNGAEQGVVLWEIVFVGFSLHTLYHAKAGDPIFGEQENEMGIADHLQEVQLFAKKFQLERTLRRVDRRVDTLIAKLEEVTDGRLPDELVDDINIVAQDMLHELKNDIAQRAVFVSMPERNIQVWDLLVDPLNWFGIDGNAPLQPPKTVEADFKEAARSFAAGFSPGAIVFTLRATEGMVREFYRIVIGRAPSNRAGWNKLIKDLRSENCPEHIATRLNKLRERRNKVMHHGKREPEEWDHQAANRVLQDARSVIRAMSRYTATLEGLK